MKRFLVSLLAVIMALSLIACSTETAQTSTEKETTSEATAETAPQTESQIETEDTMSDATKADWELADRLRAVYDNWEEDDELKVAYISKSLAGSWCATEWATVEKVCYELGATEVVGYDCNYDATKQLEFTETALAQGVDFIIYFPCDETVSTACVELCVEAGVPCMSEDDPLVGTDGFTRIAPTFQLDSYTVGYLIGENLANWAVENGVLAVGDDYSKVGLMDVDCTVVSSFTPRPDGIQDGFLSVFTDFPIDHVFRPDTKTTAPEEGYDSAAACLNANPDIDVWFLSGVNDECTVGALRAFEDLGRDENLYAAALGAYYANAEWDLYGEDSPFVTGYYISATEDGTICATAAMEYLKNGTIPFEEYNVPTTYLGEEIDWPFGWYPFTGRYCDFSNYVEVITEVEGSYTPATETYSW